MICPACSTRNPPDRENCGRCGRRLPALAAEAEGAPGPAAGFGFEDPYGAAAEQIRALENRIARMEEDLELLMSIAEYQERSWMVNRAGVQTIFQLAAERLGARREELAAGWQRRTRGFLADLSLKERFLARKRAILGAYAGKERGDFIATLGSAEEMLFSGDRTQSLTLFEHALDLDPRNGPLLVLLGQAWMDLGDIRRARTFLDRAGQVAPDDGETLMVRGILALHLEDRKAAGVLLRKATKAGVENPRLFLALGYLALVGGRLAEAEKLLQDARSEEPSAPLALLMSITQGLRGNWKDALAWSDEAVAVDPAYWDALAQHRLVARNLNHPRKEKEALRRMAALDPERAVDRVTVRRGNLDPASLDLEELLAEVNRSAHQVILRAMGDLK